MCAILAVAPPLRARPIPRPLQVCLRVLRPLLRVYCARCNAPTRPRCPQSPSPLQCKRVACCVALCALLQCMYYACIGRTMQALLQLKQHYVCAAVVFIQQLLCASCKRAALQRSSIVFFLLRCNKLRKLRVSSITLQRCNAVCNALRNTVRLLCSIVRSAKAKAHKQRAIVFLHLYAVKQSILCLHVVLLVSYCVHSINKLERLCKHCYTLVSPSPLLCSA